jgi:hypothetical protein
MRIHLVFAIAVLVGCVETEQEAPLPTIENDQFAGRVVDYFTGLPVEGVTVRTVGLGYELEVSSASAADGTFLLDNIPAGSSFRVRSSLTGMLYTPTTSTLLQLNGETAATDVYITQTEDLEAQYTAVGVIRAPNTATLFAQLLNGEGGGYDGIPEANLGLAPVEGVGPYFYGAVTPSEEGGPPYALKDGLASELDAMGRAIVGYLNIPPAGQFTLNAVYPGGGAVRAATFTAIVNEVVLATLN